MFNKFDVFNRFKENGQSDEEAFDKIVELSNLVKLGDADLVTKQDLKIAFLEYDVKLEPRFHSIDLRFNKIESKLSLIGWGLAALLSLIGIQFWYLMNRLDMIIGLITK